MIKIALCDDYKIQLDLVEEIVNDYVKENSLPAEVRAFESGEALLTDIARNGKYDIYILDMILPGIKGIELGTKLREGGDEGKIIYLTATSEFAVESYKVRAFFYLLKPIGKANLVSVLEKAIAEIKKESPKTIVIRTKSGNKYVKADDILYVDIINRALCYHLVSGEKTEGPMLRVTFKPAIAPLLEESDFVMCGARIVVNLKNIDTIEAKKVIFKCGEEIFPPHVACVELQGNLKNKK